MDEPAPEDFLPDLSERPKGPLETPPPSSHLTLVLAAYFICLLFSLLSWDGRFSYDFWVSKETLLQDHAYWRLFTALAAHADWEHLLGNAPMFIGFGWLLRSYFGLWFFPILPVLAGALANLFTVMMYQPWQRLLGCSGMAYAMVGMWLVLYLRYEQRFSVPMRLFRCLGFTLILLFPSELHPTTSYLAHGYGFLLGLLLASIGVLFQHRHNTAA